MLRRGFLLTIVLALLGCTQAANESTAQKPSASAKLPPSPAAEQGIGAFPLLDPQRDWPWWRGPSRNGKAHPAATAPIKFSATENVVWRASVPGRGHASPIVVGNRVFLATADETAKTQSVVAFDRTSGKPLWNVELSRGGFASRIHNNNTHSSSTLACDGERLFATFHHHAAIHLTALDLDGKQLWQQQVLPFDPKRYEYGYGPSPLIYRDLVIVAAEDFGDSGMSAVNRTTGKTVWHTPRLKNTTYSSPVVAHLSGRDQMLLSGADHVTSYDPATGKELWKAPGTAAATCGTIVWDGDTVIASGGYPKAETIAVKADGSARVVWRNPQRCYEQSIMAHQGFVYGLTDNGIMYCWRVADGQEMWRERLKGPVSASPVLVEDRIYWANELGTLYVFRANSAKFELLAENKLGDDSFPSPAVVGSQMFLRVGHRDSSTRQEYLYCIGGK